MISIIVPVYNAKNYIQAAVNSILTQTYATFELILVNDGSTDGSWELLQEIKNTDSRINIFTQENKGVTAARKLGWQHARGEYVTFLDADDILLDDALEILIKNAQMGDFDIVNASFTSTTGRNWQHKTLGELSKTAYLKSLIFGDTYGVLYAAIYKKELFNTTTFSFDKSIKIGEDVLMNIELCSRANAIKNIKDVVYKYTDDNNSSAMKITVRHPLYLERYYDLRNNLTKKIDADLYNQIEELLLEMDIKEIINSFFSPFIKFNDAYYKKVKLLKNKVSIPKIYKLSLSNKYATLILKYFFSMQLVIKNSIFKKNNPKVTVIY